MASYTFENHTFRMVDRTDGKDIKVPSNMYPLNREAVYHRNYRYHQRCPCAGDCELH